MAVMLRLIWDLWLPFLHLPPPVPFIHSPSHFPANLGHRRVLLNTLAANQEAMRCKAAMHGRCAEEASWTELWPMAAGREVPTPAPETLTTSRRTRRQVPFTLCCFVRLYFTWAGAAASRKKHVSTCTAALFGTFVCHLHVNQSVSTRCKLS